MPTFTKDIFRAYDIRGAYPGDFDTIFAQRLGDRVAAWLQRGSVVVARDGRATSDELAYALIDGALYAGAQVIDVGVVSTPQFYWAIRSLGAAGGVMVTASHNPLEQNGFKVITNRGGSLDVVGGDVLRQMYDGHEGTSGKKGSILYQNILDGYTAAVASAAGWPDGRELLLAIDGPSAVREVFSRLGPIAPDHRLAARYDTDGDRVVFFYEGMKVPADSIFLLLAEQLSLKPLVFDIRFSRTVRQKLDARGCAYVLSKVGRLSITEAMHRTSAALGGELSGHYYWREFGGMECPELTTLRVYDIVERSGLSLIDLVAPYQVLTKSEEISFPIRDQKHARGVLEKIAAYYHGGAQNRLDGLTVEYEDWWFNVRLSNTEPVLRLVVEVQKKDLLDAKIKEVQGFIED